MTDGELTFLDPATPDEPNGADGSGGQGTPDADGDPADLLGGPSTLEVRDVILDPVFARRRDALLRTVPVHDLVYRAERSDSGLATFDVRALVLAAFDSVIARQGFPDRTTPDQVVHLLAGIARIQDPGSGPRAHHAVAEHVLDGLTNRRGRERQFTLSSMIYAEGERGEVVATSVPRPFWLLREQEDALNGEVYLEASADAVNALVGGLDIPIEDQQVALETVLERQLARGELDAAHVTAVQARRLTAGYLIQIEELLTQTARFLPGTDWRVAAPRLINEALDHIGECLLREGRLLEHVAGGSDARVVVETSAERRAHFAALLTKLLSESRHLHTMLMRRLIGARGRFLDAQDAQMFRPSLANVEFDLTDDLLVPTLGLRTSDAERVIEEYLRAAFGPVAPVVLHWGDFVETLIHAEENDTAPPDGGDGDDLTFRADPSPLVTRDLLEATHRVLAQVPLPCRLSTLLCACPDTDGPTAATYDLLVAAALRGYDNAERDSAPTGPPAGSRGTDTDAAAGAFGEPVAELGIGRSQPVHLLEVLGPDAACYSDGIQLEGDQWFGDDLIVCADRDQLDAILLHDMPVPTPSALPPRIPREHS